MAEYIDKAKVVAKIKSLQDGNKVALDDTPYYDGVADTLDNILEYLDTLEVKEVDLEKELDYDDYMKFFDLHPTFDDDWGFEETWAFGDYCFKLGLKAQK